MALPISPDLLGARLKAARTASNLTQEAAANALGLARTTLLAIEAGKRTIRPEELRAFTDLYGVREGELLSGTRQPLDLEVKFRSTGQSTPGLLAKQSQVIQLLNRLAASSIELEELLGYSIPRVEYPRLHLVEGSSIEEQAEDAAQMFRQRLGLGLGPLPDLRAQLELEFGFRFFERPLPSEISGACSFHRDYGAFILLNSNHWAERRQQTAGHEAAHGMVRPSEPSVLLQGDIFVDKEDRFCDLFSRALQMPAASVRRKAIELRGTGRLTLRHVLWLAAYFRVSIEAMARRMEHMSMLPKGTYDSLKDRGLGRAHLEQVRHESQIGEIAAAFTPRLLFLVGEAFSRGLLSEQQIAEKLVLDLPAVREALSRVSALDDEAQ
jgi:Zn-dependent peptidase ImmA (M78 family)/transcriptional regulator with XRE-family HTH domain